jgi:protein ImuB
MRVFLAVHLPKLPLKVLRPTWSFELANGRGVLGNERRCCFLHGLPE